MKRIIIPEFYEVVKPLSTEQVAQRTQRLPTCPYNYVLCSCGRCHCENCRSTCRHETGYKPEKDMRS